MTIPRKSDVVVIGGGVIGTSIAFNLARMGAGKVVLLERRQLASGSTGLSSGLVRMHYDNPLEGNFAFKSLETFQHFDEIVGGDCGFARTGFLRTVKPHNLEELKANVTMLQSIGVNTRLVTRDEIRVLERLCTRIPAMETGTIRRGHAGINDHTPDKHALLGPAPGIEGFYCAIGFSRHGFKEAPVVGQAMAELILNGRAEIVDITPLRLTRFEEGQPYHGPYPYHD